MFPLRDSLHSCPNKKADTLLTGPCFKWPVASGSLWWTASTPSEISWSTSPGQPIAFPPSPSAPPGFYQTQSGTILLSITLEICFPAFRSCVCRLLKSLWKTNGCPHLQLFFFITLIPPFSILKCSVEKKKNRNGGNKKKKITQGHRKREQTTTNQGLAYRPAWRQGCLGWDVSQWLISFWWHHKSGEWRGFMLVLRSPWLKRKGEAITASLCSATNPSELGSERGHDRGGRHGGRGGEGERERERDSRLIVWCRACI